MNKKFKKACDERVVCKMTIFFFSIPLLILSKEFRSELFFSSLLVNSLAFRINFIFSFVPRNDVVYVISLSLWRASQF